MNFNFDVNCEKRDTEKWRLSLNFKQEGGFALKQTKCGPL